MVDSREGEEPEPSRLPAAQPGRLRTKKMSPPCGWLILEAEHSELSFLALQQTLSRDISLN